MNQTTEKKLLYYDRWEVAPRFYNGATIIHFIFKDVKTGKDVTLGSCYFAEEVSKVLGGHYYDDILKATNDFDILWSLSDEVIRPVADTFDEIQVEYQRMINEGVAPEEINSAMITLFQQKRKIKTN